MDDRNETDTGIAKSVVERVTVNLSRRSAISLDQTAELTGDSKTEVINKALQLYGMVQNAQSVGGAVWIQDTADAEPVRSRFY